MERINGLFWIQFCLNNSLICTSLLVIFPLPSHPRLSVVVHVFTGSSVISNLRVMCDGLISSLIFFCCWLNGVENRNVLIIRP